ncbi:cyclic nucleotide-binding domain-containing protein [Xanthobacteraceae bacterium A53D]
MDLLSIGNAEVLWTLVVVVGFPLVTVALIELSRRFGAPGSLARRPLKALQLIIVPAGIIWIIFHHLLQLPPDGLVAKLVRTVVGIMLLHAVLTIFQSLLIAFSEAVNRIPAPRLIYQLATSAVVVVGAAIIVSTIWDVDLGSLLGALGIGSVVLGLALQSVIGGLVAGVLLFSGRHFNLGDWLTIEGGPAKVVQIDWRAITLETLSGQRVVIPSANMATASMHITRGDQPVWVSAKVVVPLDTPPDIAKQAMRAAALDVPQLIEPSKLYCSVNDVWVDGMEYSVGFLVADATKAPGARDMFLHRLWYAGQRHGIALGGGERSAEMQYGLDTTEQRAEALAASGAFGVPPQELADLAATARLLVFAAGETILRLGATGSGFLMMLSGEARVVLPVDGSPLVERLAAGDLYATRDLFRGGAFPARVVAETEVRLLRIPAPAMERLLEHNPALARSVDLVVEARTMALRTGPGQPKSA